MSKFKKGNRVLVVGKNGIWNGFRVGDTLEVIEDCDDPLCRGITDGKEQYVSDCDLALAGEERIVVTRKGNVTTARLYVGRNVVKSAEAKCSSKDEFNFETGAALALDRLLGREEKPEPEKLFPLEEIKAGYLLKVRKKGGEAFNMTVVPGLSYDEETLGVCDPGGHWWALSSFKKELFYAGYEVIAVYGYCHNRYLLANTTEDRKLLWSRN